MGGIGGFGDEPFGIARHDHAPERVVIGEAAVAARVRRLHDVAERVVFERCLAGGGVRLTQHTTHPVMFARRRMRAGVADRDDVAVPVIVVAGGFGYAEILVHDPSGAARRVVPGDVRRSQPVRIVQPVVLAGAVQPHRREAALTLPVVAQFLAQAGVVDDADGAGVGTGPGARRRAERPRQILAGVVGRRVVAPGRHAAADRVIVVAGGEPHRIDDQPQFARPVGIVIAGDAILGRPVRRDPAIHRRDRRGRPVRRSRIVPALADDVAVGVVGIAGDRAAFVDRVGELVALVVDRQGRAIGRIALERGERRAHRGFVISRQRGNRAGVARGLRRLVEMVVRDAGVRRGIVEAGDAPHRVDRVAQLVAAIEDIARRPVATVLRRRIDQLLQRAGGPIGRIRRRGIGDVLRLATAGVVDRTGEIPLGIERRDRATVAVVEIARDGVVRVWGGQGDRLRDRCPRAQRSQLAGRQFRFMGLRRNRLAGRIILSRRNAAIPQDRPRDASFGVVSDPFPDVGAVRRDGFGRAQLVDGDRRIRVAQRCEGSSLRRRRVARDGDYTVVGVVSILCDTAPMADLRGFASCPVVKEMGRDTDLVDDRPQPTDRVMAIGRRPVDQIAAGGALGRRQ